MQTHTADTIFAFASAPVRSGVVVLRISGPHIDTVLKALSISPPLPPRKAQRVTLMDASTHQTIDEALALFFPAPHSFTGEDVLELHIHGSQAIMARLIALLAALPHLRLAQAGEFSKRAFIHGKMDLVAAEGLIDLIDAQTSSQADQALRQLQGHTGRVYEQLRTDTLRSLALLEAYMDFPDEDLPESVLASITADVAGLAKRIEGMLADGKKGQKLREGLEIILLGAPNAGKSSLLNALARRDVAIVSPIAGTTRDIIEVSLNLAGYPVTFIDTAGLRETQHSIEKEGIRRALERAENALLILEIIDIVSPTESYIKSSLKNPIRTLKIYNKLDHCTHASPQKDSCTDTFYISCLTGQGIDELIATITCIITDSYAQSEPALITRERHRLALEETKFHLEQFSEKSAIEINGEHLRRATTTLGSITGKISVDDVLDVIFSTFCIGK